MLDTRGIYSDSALPLTVTFRFGDRQSHHICPMYTCHQWSQQKGTHESCRNNCTEDRHEPISRCRDNCFDSIRMNGRVFFNPLSSVPNGSFLSIPFPLPGFARFQSHSSLSPSGHSHFPAATAQYFDNSSPFSVPVDSHDRRFFSVWPAGLKRAQLADVVVGIHNSPFATWNSFGEVNYSCRTAVNGKWKNATFSSLPNTIIAAGHFHRIRVVHPLHWNSHKIHGIFQYILYLSIFICSITNHTAQQREKNSETERTRLTALTAALRNGKWKRK